MMTLTYFVILKKGNSFSLRSRVYVCRVVVVAGASEALRKMYAQTSSFFMNETVVKNSNRDILFWC